MPENHLSDAAYPNQYCDAPNVLESECDPGSRFQVLVQTNEVSIVAHCRKQGHTDGFYGDIAVIQYNKTNGSTCFYQALGNLPATVTPPSEGNDTSQGKFPWLDPVVTAGIECVRCHDNGPFIRSPYLAQLRDEPTNRLPGTNEGTGPFDQRFTWNKDIPYKFVGNDFQSWKAYSVSVAGTGSGCTQCHRMGISSIHGEYSKQGTAQALGIIATATTQAQKNPHSVDAPIWMKPGQIFYDPDAALQAFSVASCAAAVRMRGNDPNSAMPIPAGCKAVEFAQGDTCTSLGALPNDGSWLARGKR